VGFNPRPRAGGDDETRARVAAGALFQSTPPRGGRPGSFRQQHGRGDVSIHAPARGATLLDASVRDEQIVSIHAPARGATRGKTYYSRETLMFQSTPPRGGRRRKVRPRRPRRSSFNPRPRAGGDLFFGCCTEPSSRFQSTPPRGGRRFGPHDLRRTCAFQSTPPRGGRRGGSRGPG